METVWIDSKSACLSFLCTQSLKPVCGKCLDDDLSGCKNTASCLRWWMSNTPTTCHVLYIEAVTLASCGTNAAFPDCTASQVNCNSKSRSSERSSICSQKHMRASKPSPLLLSCTAGGGALHSSESLYGIQMAEKWERGAEIERNPPLSQFKQQADEITQVSHYPVPTFGPVDYEQQELDKSYIIQQHQRSLVKWQLCQSVSFISHIPHGTKHRDFTVT